MYASWCLALDHLGHDDDHGHSGQAQDDVARMDSEVEWATALDGLAEDPTQEVEREDMAMWEASLGSLVTPPPSPHQVDAESPVSSMGAIVPGSSVDVARSPAQDALPSLAVEAQSVSGNKFTLATWRSSDVLSVAVDEDAEKVARHLLCGDGHIGTMVASANSLCVSRFKFDRAELLTAACALELERRSWSDLLCRLARGPGCAEPSDDYRLLVYCEISAYDGVDLGLACRGRMPEWSSSLEAALELSKVPDEDRLALERSSPGFASRTMHAKSKGPLNILQSERADAVAVMWRGKPMIVHGEFLTYLQHSDRTTGRCMRDMLAAQCFSMPEKEQFERKIRVTFTDRYAPNHIGEVDLLSKRSGWQLWHDDCNCHICATGMKHMSAPFRATIDGLKSYASSHQAPGILNKLQRSFAHVLSDRLRLVKPHRLSAAATLYNKFVLDTLVGDHPDCLPLRVALLRLAPGDWRDSSCYDFFALRKKRQRPGQRCLVLCWTSCCLYS